MAHWRRAPPVPHAMRSDVRLYAVSRCTRAPGETPCHDVVLPGEFRYHSPCPICSRVKSALFQGLEHNRALELAVEALHPDTPLLAMGEHWNPTIPPPLPIQQPLVLRDSVARPKVKAYMRAGGVNQGLRAPADAARQLPPPPHPPKVAGGAQGVRVASVPILPARGSNVPARVAVVKTPPPPPPPPVGATPPHAVPGGRFRLLFRQWGRCPRMRANGGMFRHIHPPVGSKGPQADLMELRTCPSPRQYGSLLHQPVLLPRSRLLKSWI